MKWLRLFLLDCGRFIKDLGGRLGRDLLLNLGARIYFFIRCDAFRILMNIGVWISFYISASPTIFRCSTEEQIYILVSP